MQVGGTNAGGGRDSVSDGETGDRKMRRRPTRRQRQAAQLAKEKEAKEAAEAMEAEECHMAVFPPHLQQRHWRRMADMGQQRQESIVALINSTRMDMKLDAEDCEDGVNLNNMNTLVVTAVVCTPQPSQTKQRTHSLPDIMETEEQ